MPVKNPRIVGISISVSRPGGAESRTLSPEDYGGYSKDPLGFAAGLFNLSKREYLEWVELDGVALCGARKKDGDFCKNLVSRIQLRAGDWKHQHRKLLCKSHRTHLDSSER